MSVFEQHMTLSEQTVRLFQTEAATDDALETAGHAAKLNRQRWQFVIDQRLVEWGRDPVRLEDENLEPPTPRAIDAAVHLALKYRDEARPFPSRVVPNGEGGIVFERRAGASFETLEVSDDGSVEYADYLGSRLLDRKRLV